MTTQPLTTKVDFNGHQLPAIHHHSRLWLTAERVGECLGYAPSNQRPGIIKIYNRHAEEFGPEDTCVVSLATQGQSREYRVFSDSGCVLLSFFASTPRAKQFRAWAKDVLASHGKGDVLHGADVPAILRKLEARVAVLSKEVARVNPQWEKISRYYDAGLTQRDIGKLLGRSDQSIRNQLKRMAACGLVDYRTNPRLAAAGRKGLMIAQGGAQ